MTAAVLVCAFSLEGSAGSELPAPPNTRVSSPAHEVLPLSEHEVLLPEAEPIPEEHRHTAEPWIPVGGVVWVV